MHVSSVYNSTFLLPHQFIGRSYYDFIYEGDLITASRVHTQGFQFLREMLLSLELRGRQGRLLCVSNENQRCTILGDGHLLESLRQHLHRRSPVSGSSSRAEVRPSLTLNEAAFRKPRSDKEASAEQSTLMQLLSAKKTPSEWHLRSRPGVCKNSFTTLL